MSPSEEKKVVITEADAKILVAIFTHLKDRTLNVDWEGIRKDLGSKTIDSARTRVGQVRTKLNKAAGVQKATPKKATGIQASAAAKKGSPALDNGKGTSKKRKVLHEEDDDVEHFSPHEVKIKQEKVEKDEKDFSFLDIDYGDDNDLYA